MVRPGYYRHETKQGQDYSIVLDLQGADGSPFDNTGYSGEGQIRTLDDALVASFAIEFPTTSTIQLSLSSAVTAALTPKRYLYDLRLQSAANVADFWLEGDVIILKAVTR